MEVKMEPRMVADYACHTGENPLWHTGERCMYWVDIPAAKLYRYYPASGHHEMCWQGEEPVGGFTIQADGALLLFMARGAIKIWRNGRVVDTVIDNIPAERDSRFNDVIADPLGRVLCGTMPTAEHPARLYRLDVDGSLALLLDDVKLSNGLGFAADRRTLYYTDTLAYAIYRFAYDEATGTLGERQVFAQVPPGQGGPDGMTVDAEGCVWSARWGGSCVVRYDPQGQEIERVTFPAREVSCPAFGGDDWSDLCVTTAGGDQKETKGQGAGALYVLRPGGRGVPEFRSRIGL
jgi:sugar lactone lactonase YvrE